VETKKQELAALYAHEAAIRQTADIALAQAATGPSARGALPSFATALLAGPHVAVIAEFKRRSPSAGEIRGDVSVADVATRYAQAGASAMSVLTDREYFGGSLDDLRAARAAVSLPLLRKDFTIDPLQVYEARGAGASAVLLIARILDDAALLSLRELAESLGMDALVEVHEEADVARALDAGARIIGVNNRDLATFQTDLGLTERLATLVPQDRVLIGESGVRDAADVERLAAAGVDAVLVGESLMRGDLVADARALTSVPRRARA